MAKVRERMCVVSRAVTAETHLVRIAIAADGAGAADLAAKAPGRGVWVEAKRASVDTAVKKNLFARSAGRTVHVDAGLSDAIEEQLAARCLSLLGLARRAGDIAIGSEPVREALRKGACAHLVEACDGAADGRGKVLALARAAAPDVAIAGCFEAAAIGAALGRGATMHVALLDGPAARKFGIEAGRLAGFRPLVPEDWGSGGG